MKPENIPKPNEQLEVPKATPEQTPDRPTTLESAKQWIADRAAAMLGRHGSEQLAKREQSLRIGETEAAEYRVQSGVDGKLAENTAKVELLSQSKRDFLRRMGYGFASMGAIGAAGTAGLAGLETLRETVQGYRQKYEDYQADNGEKDAEEELYDGKERIREVIEDVKYLREKFGIEVNVKGVEATIWKEHNKELRNPDAETWARMVHSFRRSADAYPPSMFHRIAELAPAKVIKLDLSLKTPAMKEAGFADIERYRAPSIHVNIPERVQSMNKTTAVLLSDNKGLLSTSESEMDRTIHHELAHMFIEWPVSSRKGSEGAINESLPSVWSKKFGQYNERNMNPNWQQGATEGRPDGFARYYGRKDEFEDRATVAELLFSGEASNLPRSYKKVSTEELLSSSSNVSDPEISDPVLREKIQEMKGFYFMNSGGLMDEEYWNARAAMKMLKPGPDQKWLQEKRKRMASMDYEAYKKAVPTSKVSAQEFWNSKIILAGSPM